MKCEPDWLHCWDIESLEALLPVLHYESHCGREGLGGRRRGQGHGVRLLCCLLHKAPAQERRASAGGLARGESFGAKTGRKGP